MAIPAICRLSIGTKRGRGMSLHHHWLLYAGLAILALNLAFGQTGVGQSPQFYRLYEGITAYVVNPDGKDFTVSLDVRDTNLYATGPREILFKVYDPDGKPVVREYI